MRESSDTHAGSSVNPQSHAQGLEAWIDFLRGQGIKAAQPDYGHFDLRARSVHFTSAYYNDGIKIGDRVVLGSPGAKQILVRITGCKNNPFSPWDCTYWNFEIIEQDFKPAA